ncbi:MAG: amidohydrolase family protein [Myxococcota bacterium]
MTPPQIDYWIHDADNHYYEPDDFCTRHIEERYRKATCWLDRVEPGVPARMYVGDERCEFYSVGAGDSIGRPGVMKAFLKGQVDEGGSPSLAPHFALGVPEFVDRRARLAKMDEQRVERTLMLPSAGIGLVPQLAQPKHREVMIPTLRAFNRWLEEDWGYGADGRIYGAPLVALQELEDGLAEVDRVIAAGARFVCLMAGPIDGLSPGDPRFDPFWARVEEARVGVVFHIGSTTVERAYNTAWGLRAAPPSHRHSLMEYALSFTERPVADTLTALVADNVFGRFPGLRVLSVEYGSSWVAPLLRKLDAIARLYSKDLWRFGRPPGTPSELFRRHVWVSPFFEDDVPALARTIGAERVLGGSDYPHPECLLWPMEFAEELGGMSDADVRRVLRDNFEELVA